MSKNTHVWDPLVRLFHWTLVLAFFTAYLTGDEENALHINAGYYILGLVMFRVLWGFVGTKYARFSSFNLSPRALVEYLSGLFSSEKGIKDYTGHNPAGSWMVIVMLCSLLATGFSGLKVYGEEGYGPLAQNTVVSTVTTTASTQAQTGLLKVSDHEYERHEETKYGTYETDRHGREGDREEYWEEIHEFFANFTLLLVFLHVGGVILSSIRHGHNLVRPMITGNKKVGDEP